MYRTLIGTPIPLAAIDIQVVEIIIETSTKMYTPFLIGLN